MDVREDVVRHNRPRPALRRHEAANYVRAEEVIPGLETRGVGLSREVRGWFDADRAHASLLERAQEHAVVASRLDDERAGRNEARGEIIRVRREMLEERRGGRRRVEIVAEQDLGVYHDAELHQPAACASQDLQRIAGIGAGLPSCDEGVRERRVAEREEEPEIGGGAHATAIDGSAGIGQRSVFCLLPQHPHGDDPQTNRYLFSVPFEFKPLDTLPEVVLIEPRRFRDGRGWFMETFKRSDFAAHGIPVGFVQDDHSQSGRRWVLRGLHYQAKPVEQGKLLRCVRGRIFDVVVDVRLGSPTYARWASTILSAREARTLWVPPGFAHGFLTLSESAEVVYKHTNEYSPAHNRRIRWNDPALGIPWPLEGATPLLSPEDERAPVLSDARLD